MKRFMCTVLAITLLLGGVTASVGATEIMGAGATFPLPLYQRMFDSYNREFGIRVNYQGIGSGGGIRQIRNRTVDFGGTDAILSDEVMAELKNNPLLHVPICLGAVVVTYNLPRNPVLSMTPDVIADIYLGEITKWNDERIAELNPRVRLPDMNIIVVRRSDGSGTTFIFSDYLSKVSPAWREKVGMGTSLNWPAGLGGRGNPGVAGYVKQVPGAIGYVEYIYAHHNRLPAANVKNNSGNFITPATEAVSLAADVPMPEDMRVSITDTDSAQGYPISGFTWLLVYQEQNYGGRSIEQAKALVDMLWWMTHEGQVHMPPLHYAPLAGEAITAAENLINSITYNGRPVR